MSDPHAAQIPIWAKLMYTAIVAAVVIVYAAKYKPSNFLWFSDIALLGSVVAMWLESAMLASTIAVAVLLPEIAWNVDFFGRLVFDSRLLGLSDYMFESQRPLYLRALSLFHVVLPMVLVWLVYRLGYDRRGWWIQTLIAWLVFPLTYFLTDPHYNINWVFGPGREPQQRIHPMLYLLLIMLLFPLLIYLPTHMLLLKLLPIARRG